MKQFYLLLLLSIAPVLLYAQNISVQSFKQLSNDMTARVGSPKTDQNGQKCAIIKVQTIETDFEWEPDMFGIISSEKKTGEYWLYVPKGAKRLTIKHNKLGILRDYRYPEPIQEATVYELVLVSGTVETIIKPIELVTQWIAINSKPEGANVFIEDQLVGTTPFSRKYPEGEYTYRLELPRYNPKAGKVNLIGEKKVLELYLKPHFGNIKIGSTPEIGMMIYLNDENTGKTTPTTLEGIASGEHTLKLMNQWYQPQSKRLTVTDEQTTTTDFAMIPAYADITITTIPEAIILVDGKKVGSNTYTARMLSGIYTIKADKEKHYSDQQQITVVAGNKQNITLTLRPMSGSIDIASTPFDAAITIDGKEYGTTPNTIRNLLVGDYTLTLKKMGYGTITKIVTIIENATAEVNETLKVIEETISVAQNGKTRFEYNVAEVLTDVDGNTYRTLKIGNQEWMTENLKTTRYRDGSSIPNITDNTFWTKQTAGAYCWYSNDINNKATYGALYNFYTVVDSRKLCPTGWHVPTDAEWTTLETYLGGSSVAGGKLKATTLWISPNTGATNESGFTALPGGYRFNYIGYFNFVGYYGGWWSRTEGDASNAWYRYVYYGSATVGRSGSDKRYGFSVRCIRDN